MSPHDESEDQLPERPIECTECKKPIKVLYTEIVGKRKTKTCMCNECPELQKKLHGTQALGADEVLTEEGTGMTCGSCGTTLSSVRVGGDLGCSECYEVFGDVLANELIKEKKLPPRAAVAKRTKALHIGRQPGETQELKPSLKLLALNEALKETLAQEDYEQAAWLRDKIKEITEEDTDASKK